MTRPSDFAPADAPPSPAGRHHVGERTPDGREVLVLDREEAVRRITAIARAS